MSWSVLLIPAPGDPHGLLVPGLCGSQPPRVWRDDTTGEWSETRPVTEQDHPCYSLPDLPSTAALALAWQGRVCPEGRLRAELALAAAVKRDATSGVAWRRGDQAVDALISRGRWWLETWVASAGDTGFAGGAVFGNSLSFGDFHADKSVALLRPPGIGDGPVLDMWALAAVLSQHVGGSVIVRGAP